MSRQQEDLIGEFLLSIVPPRLLCAYRTLTQLEYPISDKRSLTLKLDELKVGKGSEGLDGTSIDLIRTSLGPVDFPIENPQSALEKFHGRLSRQHGLWGPSDARDVVGRPAIGDIYERTFGRICADAAIAAYEEALLGGRNEYEAVLAGHWAGEECQRRVAQSLREFISRGRESRAGRWPWF